MPAKIYYRVPKVVHALYGLVLALYSVIALWTLSRYGMTGYVLNALVVCAAVLTTYMTVVFVVSRLIRRMDVVDAAWGQGFIVVALTSFFIGYQPTHLSVQALTTLLVSIWGVRLSSHIIRRLKGHPEDKRYVELRKNWRGHEAINSFVRIFLLQAALIILTSIAVVHINLFTPQLLSPGVWIGLGVWVIGFTVEAVSDAQLRRHVSNPKKKGTLLTSGLWRYSRHPNYFGELTVWIGIACIAMATPFGWVGLITPLTIGYLLLGVSGVPITERSFAGRSGWDAYAQRTSVFVPWWPKNSAK